MKAVKRIACLALSIVMICLAFATPVSAAGATPLVMINGIGSTDLYKNFGTEDEELAFSFEDEEFVEGFVKEIGTSFVGGFIAYGIAKKDYNKMADVLLPVVNKYISGLGIGLDGTPVDSTIGFHRTDKPLSEYTEEEKEGVSQYAKAYADKYGEDCVYDFTYDWRADPVEIAEELNDFILTIKAKENVKRVNMVAMSMGSAIALAYMNAYGGKHLDNVVFAAPAWQGTSIVGNVLTNNVELDVFASENYLVQLANGSATTHIIAFVISYIASTEELSREYFGDVNQAIQGILPRLYTDTLIPYFIGMPGLWSLCPAEDYEAAKEFIFEQHEGVTLTPEYEAQLDAYHNIQVNAKSVIEKVMKDGAKFNIVCGYNCQIAPVSNEFDSSDGIVDTKYMSGGATCAKYLQSNKDWGKVHTQAVKDGHNHLSWDGKVDASTCMFPEQTWFIKNMQHNNMSVENGSMEIVLWLLSAKTQRTVHDDVEHPQFFLYNTYKRTTKAMPIDKFDILGDVNFSGAVNVYDDAKLALRFASSQKKPTEDQLLIGDIDEDGEFTTDDVRSILAIAAGIDY